MEIGSVNEIARLTHILFPNPNSWYTAEAKISNFKEEKILKMKKISFSWLHDLIRKLYDNLKTEGIRLTSIYFSPSLPKNIDRNTIYLECKPSILSFCLRDWGIFTKKYFLSATQLSHYSKKLYGNVIDMFVKKLSSLNIPVYEAGVEGGSFISNGKIGIVSMKNELSKYKELIDECGELYNFPEINLHIDSIISFLGEDVYLMNYDLLKTISEDLEYSICCNFKRIEKLVEKMKEKKYSQIKINGYYYGSEASVVTNILNIGKRKVVVVDNKGYVEKLVSREGFDVINLYPTKSFEMMKNLYVGIRCITLPVKRE
ncbi:MAG: hypothetical protein RMJ17_00235, partial [Candidatus Aenigmarchaeota archaeon]|nr:hypothetical protein [Candidatus Aenigmarchaeota archaeon]MDW8149018.1 hypothetical protein [Candidatus Aenigmarchaeota archaeon]